MHIPGKRIYNEIRSEEGGIWFVPANNGEEIATLIKAPSNILKSIISGCKINFAFGIKNKLLCSGARIYDISDAPVFISNTQRHLEEHNALWKFLIDKESPIFLFNELDVCVASSNALISNEAADLIKNLIGSIDNLYCGNFTPQLSSALDDFCFSIDSTQDYQNASKIPAIEISVEHGPWVSNSISFTGNIDHKTTDLSESNEGETLEKYIWAALESVFPFNLHHSPTVHIGKKARELTDVITSHKYGTFLFESKALSIFSENKEKTRERRLKSIQKHTQKAITQLIGASKASKRGEKITTHQGNEIRIVTDQPFHCIVLLTELMHEGDWSEIEKQIIDAMLETGDYFHILDLRELINLLKISNGKSEHFDYHLMERCKIFIKNGSVHIRSRLAHDNK